MFKRKTVKMVPLSDIQDKEFIIDKLDKLIIQLQSELHGADIRERGLTQLVKEQVVNQQKEVEALNEINYPFIIEYENNKRQEPWVLKIKLPCTSSSGMPYAELVVSKLIYKLGLNKNYLDNKSWYYVYFTSIPTMKEVKETIEEAKEISRQALDKYEVSLVINEVRELALVK